MAGTVHIFQMIIKDKENLTAVLLLQTLDGQDLTPGISIYLFSRAVALKDCMYAWV